MRAELTGCVDELDRRSLLPADRVAVAVVGSVARGWANVGSDYDIYVVAPTAWRHESARTVPVSLDPPAVSTLALMVDGRRWEVKYWLDSQVDQMLAKVTWQQFEHGSAAANSLVDAEEIFLERLATCVPLEGQAWVERRRTELDDSAFRAFVVTRSLAEADDCAEDALGQLASDDMESAVISAHRGLGFAVDALLESYGQYGSRTPKWRARRFRAAAPRQMSFEEYWALETMRGLDPEAPRSWIEHVVVVCKGLSAEVEI